MKKIYMRVLLVVAFVFSVAGAEAKLINFGVAAGTTISNYSVSGLNDCVNNKEGFQVGLHATVKIPIISVTPEIWYTQSRFTLDSPYSSTVELADFKVRSVELPVVAGLTILKVLTLEAGPRFTLYNSATAEVYGEDYDIDGFNSSVGYVAGAKVTLLNKIILGARYNGEFGTSDMNLDNYSVKSETITIMVGYKF